MSESVNTITQITSDLFKRHAINRNANVLHPRQHPNQRNLGVVEQRTNPRVVDTTRQRPRKLADGQRNTRRLDVVLLAIKSKLTRRSS